jgi:hypothetical protein
LIIALPAVLLNAPPNFLEALASWRFDLGLGFRHGFNKKRIAGGKPPSAILLDFGGGGSGARPTIAMAGETRPPAQYASALMTSPPARVESDW